MRTLNVVFTDKEFKAMEKVKEYCSADKEHQYSWHDFIMLRISAIKGDVLNDND